MTSQPWLSVFHPRRVMPFTQGIDKNRLPPCSLCNRLSMPGVVHVYRIARKSHSPELSFQPPTSPLQPQAHKHHQHPKTLRTTTDTGEFGIPSALPIGQAGNRQTSTRVGDHRGIPGAVRFLFYFLLL